MITDFRSSFTEELAKPSRFDVFISPITVSSRLSNIMDAKLLTLRCESASLPGRTLSTLEHKIYGPVEKYPYQSTYDDITLSFICTDSMKEKDFFNSWMDIINPLNTWNFKYKKDYVSDIVINQYDNSNNMTHYVKLIEAFPVSVNELSLDWSQSDAYHKLSVTFAYIYWTRAEDDVSTDPSAPSDQQVVSNIPSLLKSGPDSQVQGTYLDISNHAIGTYNTFKDQYASGVNKQKQTQGIIK